MNWLNLLIDYGVIGLLIALSIWSVAVALERFSFYRRVQIDSYISAVALETALTRRLVVIGTTASNAPYIGLLGTVMGIMLTFYTMGSAGVMDVKTIMVGLSLSLKATAMGLVVAIPCVVMNNVLRRRVRELLAAYSDLPAKQGGDARGA
jgi:biopolymer transport protein ExbB